MIVYDQTKEIKREEGVVLPFAPEPLDEDHSEILAVWAVVLIVMAIAVAGVFLVQAAK